jgi:membrane protease YdiL (CAAX protease family)
MAYNDHNSAGAAPTRARSNDPMDSASEEVPPSGMEPPAMEPHDPAPQNLPDDSLPLPAPPYHAGISDDLRVPWGWLEVALFVIFGVIGSVVVTWGMAQVAVRFFGANSNDVFGDTISTAKSVVVLISQAVIDGLAILYLYLMLLARTDAPFWRSIGWREMVSPGAGKIRDSALQFLAGGAVLAIVVSFAGGFLNSKETLPIEELLKARVSIVLFGILGVLVAPLVEETIFRGFLYPVIARRLGIAAGIAITGTLFGLMHAAQLWGGWGQIALLILVGVVLTWVRARTGTVAASYFVHLGYNGLQLVGYLIYVVSGSHH